METRSADAGLAVGGDPYGRMKTATSMFSARCERGRCSPTASATRPGKHHCDHVKSTAWLRAFMCLAATARMLVQHWEQRKTLMKNVSRTKNVVPACVHQFKCALPAAHSICKPTSGK
eukprot:scaffold284725_cov19-Tisochrysis_lutea.AAC.2